MQVKEISSQLSSKQSLLATVALCLATFMFVLDYTIANVAVPYIAGSLGASADEGTYVITFFAVGNALGLPLTGWLSKRFGMIHTLIYSIGLFTMFSILCGISQSLLEIVAFRFLQGLSAGPIVPLSQNCLGMVFSRKRLGVAMAFFSMIVLTAPVLGPIIGGIFCIKYSWPLIFFINIPFGIFCCVIISTTLKQFETEKVDIPIDKLGFFCLFIGSTCLQIFLDKGEQWDWWNSTLVRVLIILSILSFFYLFLDCKMKKRPLLDLSLWSEPSYSLSVITLFFLYGLYIAIVVLIPFWLQIFMGYNAYLAGLAVCTIGVVPVLFSIFVPKLMARIGCLLIIVIGCLGMAASCFITMFFTTQVDLAHIAFSRLFVGVGLLFWISPLFKLAMSRLDTKDLPMALGMLHFFRAISGGIGTSIAMTVFKRRAIFHHSNLVSSFNDYTQSSKNFIDKIQSLGIRDIQANEITNKVIDKQAAMLSLNDVSYAMGIIFVVISLVLVLNYNRVGHYR